MNFARRFLVTGSRGAFGGALAHELALAGAAVTTARFGDDWTYADYGFFSPALLSASDVLVLAHGAKGETAMDANFTSFVAIAERYRKARPHPEIWALGSEIELHGTLRASLQSYLQSKRAWARHAATLYAEESITYRHIVPAAFRSGMGPGLMSARTAARWAMGLLALDWRYVPVTYTGLACLNYFRFRRLARQPASATRAPG